MSGLSPISWRVGSLRRTAARMSVSIGVAALVMTTVVPAASASAPIEPCPDTHVTCALIMGFTSLPTPDDAYIDAVRNQFIAPTHPGQHIKYVAVTTPEEGWPLTGLIRLGCAAVGAPSLCGPGGAAWPDEPWWKLSGLFDLTYDQSNRAGLADLEAAVAEHPNDHLVIYGYSQGAAIANVEKQRLAEQYPWGTTAPDIDFVLGGDPNLPNGGLHARFPGLYIPILDWSFNGPESTDTQFDTVVITRQYDAVADFPLYPLNLVADLNAALGFFYVHLNGFDVSLADDAPTSPSRQETYGDTDYYFFETQDLPLFGPLRTLGVPEKYIDVVEPFFRVLVELGYDRSIPLGEPTPARLLPMHDPATVAADLVDAVGEGIDNALALTGSAPLPRIPAPGVGADSNDGGVAGSPEKVVDRNAVGDGIATSLRALNPVSIEQTGADGQNPGPQTPLGRWRTLTPRSLTDGFKFPPLKARSSPADNQTGGPSAKAGANIGGSLQQLGQNVVKTVKKATDSVTKGLGGFSGHRAESKG